MARSLASGLFFLALCSSLILHPAFARNTISIRKHFFGEMTSPSTPSTATPETAPSPAPSEEAAAPVAGSLGDELTSPSTEIAATPATTPSPAPSEEAVAPVAGSLGMIVASQKGKSFTKHICELSSDPLTCSKILAGNDQKFMASLPRGTTTMLSIQLSEGLAKKASIYMIDKLASHRDRPAWTAVLNGCIENYKDAIQGFNGAYRDFKADPARASKSLHDADAKIGECVASLISEAQESNLPRIEGTNKLLRDLIQLVDEEMK